MLDEDYLRLGCIVLVVAVPIGVVASVIVAIWHIAGWI